MSEWELRLKFHGPESASVRAWLETVASVSGDTVSGVAAKFLIARAESRLDEAAMLRRKYQEYQSDVGGSTGKDRE